MKYVIAVLLTIVAFRLGAQEWRPTEFSVSYFGETVTHPGIRAGVSFKLKGWHKHMERKNKHKVIHKSILFQPSVGYFYHQNYQSAFFVLPEISLMRKNEKGSYRSVGLGAGYLKTFLPNVYELTTGQEVVKVNSGYDYFLTNLFFLYGRDINFTQLSIYVKPQLLLAVPSTAGSLQYVAMEIGIKYRLASH